MWERTKGRKVLGIGTGVLLLFLLFCAKYVENVGQSSKADTLADLQAILGQDARRIEEGFSESFRLVEGVAYLAEQTSYETRIDAYLRAFGGEIEDKRYLTSGCVWRFADGQVLYVMKDAAAGKIPEKRSVFFLSRDLQSGEERIAYDLPLLRGGESVGLVRLTRTVNSLEAGNLLHDFCGGSGICYIVNDAGEVFLRSANARAQGEFTNLLERISALERPQFGAGRSGTVSCLFPGGGRRYVVYAPVGGDARQWNLVCVVPADFVAQKSRAIVWQTFALCALALLLLLLLLAYILRMRDEAKADLERLAYYDTLTGRYNLNYFLWRAAVLLRENATITYAVLCLDMKNFKYVNQTYGYEVGDALICDLARSLDENFFGKELSARVGNDRFAILYAMEEYPSLLRYYAVVEEFVHRQNFGAVRVSIELSTGVYEVADRSEKVLEMVDKATLALNAAKKTPLLQCVMYDNTLLQDYVHEEEIKELMHAAMQAGEFKVYLQPKFDLHAQCFTAAEALVRWDSKKKGRMQPDEFIPLFERNGFIVDLDFYMLEEVCRKMRAWLEAGKAPAVISVNQSRMHMNHPLYLERLETLLQKYEIPPHLIELELTESMFFSDNAKLIEIIAGMHEIGLLVSMDDFGAGYSSLHLLKEIPMDILKLDKGFLDDVETSERSRIIVRKAVEMAKQLGMQVVSEGVETKRQAEFLSRIGCDFLQGYFYAKPMPIEEFDAFCADWERESSTKL